jgi:hypothetical protein
MIECRTRQGKRHKQLLSNLKNKRGYWNLKEEALDRIVCRTRFVKHDARQTILNRVSTTLKTEKGSETGITYLFMIMSHA